MIFHFVKSELKELKGAGRATITDKDAKELEEKGVFLHSEQRKGAVMSRPFITYDKRVLRYKRRRESYRSQKNIPDHSISMLHPPSILCIYISQC